MSRYIINRVRKPGFVTDYQFWVREPFWGPRNNFGNANLIWEGELNLGGRTSW